MCQSGLAASVQGRPLGGPCGAVGSFGNALETITATVWVGQRGSVDSIVHQGGIHIPDSCPLDPFVDLRMGCPEPMTHSFLLNHCASIPCRSLWHCPF